MTIDPKQLAQWALAIGSKNMGEVLNTMLDIVKSGDLSALTLLEEAGSNLHPMVLKGPMITLPEGEYTFEEFRDRCIAELTGNVPKITETQAEKEKKIRLAAFQELVQKYASEISPTIADEGRRLLVDLIDARTQTPTKSPSEIYCDIHNCHQVRKVEDSDPTQSQGGPFSFSLDVISDTVCHHFFEKVIEYSRYSMKVTITTGEYDLKRIRAFWIKEVRPQQMAFSRVDLLDLYMDLPADGWFVGPR